MIYCYVITIWVPTVLICQCGGLWRVVICHPTLSLEIVTVQSSSVHGIEDGSSQSYCHTHGRHRFFDFWLHWGCVGHPQQGFMVSLAHWDSVSNMAVVIQYYSYEFAAIEFDGNTNPITTVGTSLETVPFQNVNQHCLGVVTRAPDSTITCASFSIGICTTISIAMVAPTRPIMSPGPISTERLIYYLVRWWDRLARYTWDDVKDKNRYLAIFESYVFMLDYRSNQRFLASSVLRTRPATSLREAHFPCLVVLLLIIPAPSLTSTLFLSRSISPSLTQYVWSLPIPNRQVFSHYSVYC